jgi:TRAP-type mannitol/chloroaromatic compound transport system substrate-binding protein
MRSTGQDNRLFDPVVHGLKLSTGVMELGANLTLDDDLPSVLSIDPGADGRKVICQAASEANDGRMQIIYNAADAAETIDVRNTADDASIGTIEQGETGVVLNVKGTWICFAAGKAVPVVAG